MYEELDQSIAHRIIASVGSAGVPPEYGFQYFTVGLDDIIDVIDKEYLKLLIKGGGSSFKVIIGGYGSGKTHLLYTIRELAWKNNFATSYVTLTPEETPFHKLELVFGAIVNNLQPPLTGPEILSGSERGIENFLIRWFNTIVDRYRTLGLEEYELNDVLEEYVKSNIKGYESTSFTNAIRQSFLSLLNDNYEDFETILTWLKGESYNRRDHSKYGILQKIDKTTAFPRLRSLGNWIRSIGYSGLVILFDEAEQTPSFSSRQISLHLNNLRQLIDACQSTSFQGFMIFYAIPDEDFLQRRGFVYEALKQRLATYFNAMNPSGVKLNLEELFGDRPEQIKQLLFSIGNKLSMIYSIAYDVEFDSGKLENAINLIVEKAFEQRFIEVGILRTFVQKVIEAFHYLRNEPNLPFTEETADQIIKG
ncbi:MAG: DUF2791 family P-loop domain-containing protein [Desulfobacterales bacterium]|nr:DUF2791 family P-loop domain-containing protein [Desulfobacterales bacterium]